MPFALKAAATLILLCGMGQAWFIVSLVIDFLEAINGGDWNRFGKTLLDAPIWVLVLTFFIFYTAIGIYRRNLNAWALAVTYYIWSLVAAAIDAFGYVILVMPETAPEERTPLRLAGLFLERMADSLFSILAIIALFLLLLPRSRRWINPGKTPLAPSMVLSLLVFLGWICSFLLFPSSDLSRYGPKENSPLIRWALGATFSAAFWICSFTPPLRRRLSLIAPVLLALAGLSLLAVGSSGSEVAKETLTRAILDGGGTFGDDYIANHFASEHERTILTGLACGLTIVAGLLWVKRNSRMYSDLVPPSPSAASALSTPEQASGNENGKKFFWEMYLGRLAIVLVAIHTVFNYTAFRYGVGPYYLSQIVATPLVLISLALLLIMTLARVVRGKVSIWQGFYRASMMAFLGLGVWLYGTQSFFERVADLGTKHWLMSRWDFDKVQEWAIKIVNDPEAREDKALMDLGPGGTIKLHYSDKVLPEIAAVEPFYMSVIPAMGNEPSVRFGWGGGFHHWGVYIGSPSFEIDNSHAGHSYTRWQPGIYGYQE